MKNILLIAFIAFCAITILFVYCSLVLSSIEDKDNESKNF